MRIQDITLENFRSIAHIRLKEIQNLVCFIGPHNSGKTNILTGISVFWDPYLRAKVQRKQFSFGSHPKTDFDSPGSILSYLGNTNSIHGNFKLEFQQKSENLKSWPDNQYIERNFNEIAASHRKSYSLTHLLSELEAIVDPSTISGFIFDLKMNPESLSINELKCDLCLYNGEKILFNSDNLHVFLQVIGTTFIRRFHDIYAERESLNKSLLKILQNKDYEAISLIEDFLKDVLDQEFIFKLVSTNRDNKNQDYIDVTIERAFSSPLWRISSSTARIIAIAHLLTTSPVNQIVILDEPGLHLHPKGERSLAKKMEILSKNHQFFFSTHSSRFLIGYAYLVELKKGWTKISTIHGKKSMNKVVKLLGIRPSDSFGSDVVVFTEGRTDARVFRIFEDKIKSEGTIVPTRISWIGVGGWTNLKFTLSIELLRTKFVRSNAVAITDGDIVGSDSYFKLKQNWATVFSINSLFSLNEECIESLFLNNPIVFQRLAKTLNIDNFPNLSDLLTIISSKRAKGISDKTITIKIVQKFLNQEYRSSLAEKLAINFKTNEIPKYLVDFFSNFILI